MTRKVWVVVLVAGSIAACSSANSVSPTTTQTASPHPPLPELARQLSLENDGLRLTLTVRDELSVLVAVTEGAPDISRAHVRGAVAINPPGDERKLQVSWTAYPCQLEPVMVLTRQDAAYFMILDRGIVPEHCEAMAFYWAVTLELSEPIRAADLTLIAVGEALVEPDAG